MNRINVFIQDGEKNRYTTTAKIQTDRFFFNDQKRIYDTLLKGGIVKFSIEDRNSFDRYRFDIEVQGFADAYYALFGVDP
jgi:hypothetical protein